jgi:signal transduction histidine kinase
MRRRLTASYLILLVLVLVALEVPLAITYAGRATERLVADRLADATRYATLAEPALRANETASLRLELARYDEVYGIAAAVIDQSGQPIVSSRASFPFDDAEVRRQIALALGGHPAGDSRAIWPWRSAPSVVAVPVGSGGENLGAVVTISPVQQQARSVAIAWVVLFGGGLIALAAGVAAAWMLGRWALRPVAVLDAAAHDLTAGDYAVRVPVDEGPPELRRLAAAFNEMVETVDDVLDRQRSFVSHASHQLRNPLTALRLRVEDLAELTGDEVREGHRLALEETDRLAKVLDGLLALAKADRGQFRQETVDAGQVAWDRVVAWQPVAARRGVNLRYVRPPRPLTARAVATALDQALDALIDNAVKFSGTDATVTVRVAADDGGVSVHVTDSGPGLTDEQRDRATERFWRAPHAQNVEGSGLGLPIVAVLLDASRGRLDLLPAEPHGLHARLWLPAGDSSATPSAPGTAGSHPDAAATGEY